MNQRRFLRPTIVPLRDKTYKAYVGARNEWKKKKRTLRSIKSQTILFSAVQKVMRTSAMSENKGDAAQLIEIYKKVRC